MDRHYARRYRSIQIEHASCDWTYRLVQLDNDKSRLEASIGLDTIDYRSALIANRSKQLGFLANHNGITDYDDCDDSDSDSDSDFELTLGPRLDGSAVLRRWVL